MLLPAVLLAFALAPPRQAPATERVPADVGALIMQGDQQRAQWDLSHALNDYKKADKLAGHQCATCLLRMAYVERVRRRWGNAARDASLAAAVKDISPQLRAAAHLACGSLLAEEAGPTHPTAKQLPEAEAEFRAALSIAPSPEARWKLGLNLLRQDRQADGMAELRTLGQDPAAGDLRAQAAELIHNPGLAHETLAPLFSVTDAAGQTFSLAQLRGKVVLVHFWDSRCITCRDSAQMVEAVYSRYAQRKDFAMLSISTEYAAAPWQSFIASHHMTWPQYLDTELQIAQLFAVEDLPTYVVIERDGSMVTAAQGLDMAEAGRPSYETRAALIRALDRALARPAPHP